MLAAEPPTPDLSRPELQGIWEPEVLTPALDADPEVTLLWARPECWLPVS